MSKTGKERDGEEGTWRHSLYYSPRWGGGLEYWTQRARGRGVELASKKATALGFTQGNFVRGEPANIIT